MSATGSRRWRPRWTLRLRLTLLYGGLFLAAGTILLAITYGLVAHDNGPVSEQQQLFVSRKATASIPPVAALHGITTRSSGHAVKPGTAPTRSSGGFASGTPLTPPSGGLLRKTVLPAPTGGRANKTAVKPSIALTLGPTTVYFSKTPNSAVQLSALAQRLNDFSQAAQRQVQHVTARAKVALKQQHSDELSSLLTQSGIALGIMALVSIGLGWLMAGRALRPVRTMSTRARGISERNLHERLALDGPNDELKELGDTFDELLGRLETAFESQRRFVSNASHELRTPITLERTLVEVALADPNASMESLKDTCRRVLAAGEQQERLIEALLTLARSQRGLAARERVELSEITADVIRGVDARSVRLESELDEAQTSGDPRLIERLIANLLDNALKYNQQGGWVSVRTGIRDGLATIEVENTGPVIDPDRVRDLVEPFQRLNGERAAAPEPVGQRGLGLGLSIVDAIARAHGARLTTIPRAEGGLAIQVRFPAVRAAYRREPRLRARPEVSLH